MKRVHSHQISIDGRIPRAAAAAVLLLALLPLLTRGAGAVGGPSIDVVIEDSYPAMIWEPGAKAAFGIAVTNTSSEPVTITAATESLDGSADFDISIVNGPIISTTCGAAVGTVLAAGGMYTCNFIRYVGGDVGDLLTERVTVTAQDGGGASSSDQGDRTYEILDALPTADVTNSADLTSLSAPGADVTYTTSVTNTSPEPVTITAATESLAGGPAYDLSTANGPVLNTTCDDAVGTVLAPEATYSCNFMVFVGGGAGAVRTDRVTFTFQDDESNTASSHADHTFVIVAGPSGAVWGVTSAGSVYRFDARWARQSGRLAQLDVGNKGEVWGVTAAGSVYRRVGSGGWTRMPGALEQVSVGSRADGSSLVMGVTAAGSVYRFDSGSWTRLSGRLAQLEVGNKGEVWGVTAAGSVYRYAGGNQWTRMPGSLKQVSVGSNSDGSTFVWGLASDGSVRRFQGGSWTGLPGRLDQIDVGSGQVWGVTAAGSVYRYAGGYRWTNVGGRLEQVSAGTS